MECEYCHRSGHVWFQCPKKPDGWKPERLAKRSAGAKAWAVTNHHSSQVAQKVEQGGASVIALVSYVAGSTPALPADTKPKRKDTRKGDRHSPGYMAKYMREYRAKLKAQKGER